MANNVRTAEDLERKYNFKSILGLDKNFKMTSKSITQIQNELASMLNTLIINLADVLDSQSEVSLWFYSGTPTFGNEPYSSWTDPTEHYGDIYYDQETGYVYQFTDEGWVQKEDQSLIQAMALTNSEIDTEADHERKVYFEQPTPPYSNGDWWILEDGTLKICQLGRDGGIYEKDDFVVSSKYTSTVATKMGDTITVLQGTIQTISNDYVSTEIFDTQSQRVSKVEQTVDELNAKISDISDITVSGETEFASTNLDNVNESEPISIQIHPTTTNISYLYPNSNLFPGDSLFSKTRTLRFHNNTTSEDIDYVLPDNLLVAPDGTYDEFYLGYSTKTCQITKKCKYNADGTVSLLDKAKTTTYDYPEIDLTTGDYTVSLLGYANGYINIRLMASNIYTDQFVTRVEESSDIEQTKNSITASVDAKLTGYSTTEEMNSTLDIRANQITSAVSNTYATKDTTTNLQTQITQNANEISTKVTSGDVVSEINQSAEQITLNSNRLVVNSNNFSLSSDGTMSCSNANVSGTVNATSGSFSGTINATSGTFNGTVNATNGKIGNMTLKNGYLTTDTGGDGSYVTFSKNGITFEKRSGSSVYVLGQMNVFNSNTLLNFIRADGSTNSKFTINEVTASKYNNLSLQSKKENFEKVENTLNIVKKSEIYKFNYKGEQKEKKQYGFVIPDEGGDFNTPTEVIEDDGINLYSMISILWRATQEQQQIIEDLQERINKLENKEE